MSKMIIRSCINAKFVNFWKSVSALGLLFVIMLLARIAGAQCTSQFTAPIVHGAPPPTLSGTVTFTENYNCGLFRGLLLSGMGAQTVATICTTVSCGRTSLNGLLRRLLDGRMASWGH